MRQLTQDEAIRCAKALGWKRFRRVVAEGGKPVRVWAKPGMNEGEYVSLESTLKWYGPEYWFPRLWERLEELKLPDTCATFESPTAGNYAQTYSAGIKHTAYGYEYFGCRQYKSDHPCLALCAAIEARRVKNG